MATTEDIKAMHRGLIIVVSVVVVTVLNTGGSVKIKTCSAVYNTI
jgi:hypothetical protein